jgi:NDP-sugar pyrophosphorylase family protein
VASVEYRAESDDRLDEVVERMKAVVLAGGRGARLAPYTSVLPKPLMPVGERSILEIVVEQLEEAGITDINFCVGYLSHLIKAVFDNRQNGHVDISYVRENDALGTAAPLRLVEGLDDTFLVMNGDVLTTLDYRELVRYHRAQDNVMTIATHNRTVKIDYGIVHLDVRQRLRHFEEKPELSTPVSMGIYVMEPDVLEHIPPDQHFDFPDLVQALLDASAPIGGYRHDGLWFDIGRHEDYEQAAEAWVTAHRNGNGNGNGRRNTGPGTAQVQRNRVRQTNGAIASDI